MYETRTRHDGSAQVLAAPGMSRRLTLGPALLILAVWVLLTIGAGLALGDGQHASLSHAAGAGIGFPWLFAAALALAVAWRNGAGPMGLGAPKPFTSIRLVWLPLAYVCAMLAVDVLIGVPAPATLLVVAINMILVGLSEEVMFRSIVFHGMLARFRIWPAVLLTSLLFGAVHTLNVFGTGQLQPALMQSLTAFMQGVAYQAIRLRTGSVWPMVGVHALWDFSLVLPGLSHPAGDSGSGGSLLPVVVALPVFLYGLFLLRHLQRDYGNWSEVAHTSKPHGDSP